METRRELDFISKAQVWYSDIRHYYIGGYSSYENRDLIDACTLDNSGAGKIKTPMSLCGFNECFSKALSNRSS